MVFQGYFKEDKEVSRVFLECFKEAYGGLKMVCFVFAVGKSSQLPEQKEGLFSLQLAVSDLS